MKKFNHLQPSLSVATVPAPLSAGGRGGGVKKKKNAWGEGS